MGKATRDPWDRDYTPDALALAIAHVVRGRVPMAASVVDLGTGGGAFVRAAREAWPGATVDAIDIDPDATGLVEADNGVALPLSEVRAACGGAVVWDVAIGNPPFSIAEAFIRDACAVADHVAFLLPGMFFGGAVRRGLWVDGPAEDVKLSHVWPILERPTFRSDGKTDAQVYAVAMWSRGWSGPACYGPWLTCPGGWGRPRPRLVPPGCDIS